jgi:hypothetical protein
MKIWLENSQSYSKYSLILIGTIFHRNIQITKNIFHKNLFKYTNP